MAKALFKLNPVYPAKPDLEQYASELTVLDSADMVLAIGPDGIVVAIPIPPSITPDGSSLAWNSITGKPEFFPTTWRSVSHAPLVGVPAGSVVDFFGNSQMVLTGVFATDSDLILTLGGGNADNPFWRVCDGTNGTPDLRGRFRLGAGQGSGLTDRVFGSTGGEESHALTVAELPVFPPAIGEGGNPGYVGPPSGTGDAHNTMPPFSVCYPIMRTERF